MVTARRDELRDGLRRSRELHGATPGALESFLAVRGARTMALRVERAQANALILAERLAAHPRVAVESTIERRAAIPGQEHLPPSLLRLSVGIENVEDFWADLAGALEKE